MPSVVRNAAVPTMMMDLHVQWIIIPKFMVAYFGLIITGYSTKRDLNFGDYTTGLITLMGLCGACNSLIFDSRYAKYL